MRPVDENTPDPKAYSGSVYDSSLESDTSTVVSAGSSPAALRPSRQNFSSLRFSRLALKVSAVAVLLIVVTGVGSLLLTAGHGNKADKDSSQPSSNYSVSKLTTASLPSSDQLQVGEADKLAINGQLEVNNTIVLSPTSQPTSAVSGQIYYDKTTQAPYYYNGSSFVSLAPTATPQHVTSIGGAAGLLALGSGLEVDGNTLAISSSLLQSVASVNNGSKVTSLQGLTGAVSLVAGNGVAISGTTITNGGVVGLTSGSAAVTITHDANGNYSLSYGGVAGLTSSSSAVSVSHDSAGNYTIGYGGVASLTAGSSNLTVTNDGSGNYTVTDTSGGGSSAGQVTLGPSTVQPDSTGNTSIHVNKTGAGNFLDFASSGASTFVVNQSGQIVTGTINYSQVQGAPTSTVTAIGGVSGAISLGTGLSLSGSSLSNSGVTSLTGTPNQVTVSAGTGAVTISLPQDISTGSTPSFAGANLSGNLTATSATFNGNLTVSGANSLTTGSGTVTLGSLGAGLVQSNSSGVLSSGTVDRNSADFSGTLSTANGGTGNTSFTNGGVIYGTGTGLQSTPAGSAGQLLVINSSALPNLVSLSGDGSLTSTGSLTISKLQGNSLSISAPANGQVLQYNGSGFVNSLIINSNLQAGSFSNITGVGPLTSGSITTGFGTIATTSDITTTTTLQGNVVNAAGSGAAVELNGLDVNTAGTLSNVAYLNQANTFTAANNKYTGTVNVQGAGGLTLGTPGVNASSLNFANSANSRQVIFQGLTPSGTGNATVQIPSVPGGTTDQVCLFTLGNCVGSGGAVVTTAGTQNYITKYNNAAATQISNSQLFDNGTFVGVNTTTDNGQVSVVTSGTQTGFYLQGATTGSNAVTVIKAGGSSGDLLDLESSTGTVLAKVDNGGNLTAVNGSLTGTLNVSGNATFSGNLSQSGSGSFSTGSGAVNLNGSTTVSGANTFSTGSGAVSLNGDTTLANGKNFSQSGSGSFSTGSGAVSLNGAVSITGVNTLSVGTGSVNFGGSLGVGGLTTLTGGATVSGAVAINTTGTANTAIGNSSGTFSVASSGFNVNTGGAVSGVSTLSASGAIAAATSSNTINGLVINGGALSSVASIATAGGYSQTGSSANTFSGATTFGASGTALTVNNNAAINGTANVGTLSVANGGISDSGTLTVSSTSASSIAGQLNLTATGTGLNVSNNATIGGSLAVTSAAGLTLGSTTNNGLLSFDNGANVATLQIAGPSSGSGTTTYSVPGITAGTSDTICLHNLGNCGASASTVTTSSSGTLNSLAKFTGANTIANSGISDDGTTVTVSEALSAATILTSTIQSSGALAITPGGNATIGASNHILALQGNASSTFSASDSGFTTSLGFVTPTANNTINLPNASGTICLQNSSSCGFATSGSGVTSVNAATGALTINNTSTVGTAITINNASTTQKGIAQFNSSDFSASGGTIDTIQGITTSSAVQFGSLTLGSGDLTLSSTAKVNTNAITSLGNGISFDAGANAITFTTANGTNSFVFPTYGGTGQVICTSGISCTSGGGTAVVLEPSGVQTASMNRTAIFISKASGTGNLLELQAGGTDALVIDNSGNATISNATTIASLTVPGTITTSSIVPTSALTVGAFGQSFSLQGTSASTISATAGSYKTNVGFATGSGASAPTGNVTYNFQNDSTVSAGTYTICTTAGNCAGVGGGVTTSGGNPNTLAKFTASGNIANSIVTDDGSTVTIGGALAVGTSTSGQISLGVASSSSGTLVFNNATNTNTITLSQAGAPAANTTVKLPNASGTVAVSATGPISLDALTGQISCASCLTTGGSGGSAGVSSVDGLSGALTLNNSSGSGSSITIDNASTTQKGIAQFNATNFTASSGTINTVQDIASSASPTFTNLTLQGSSGLLVGSSSNVGQLAFKDGTVDGYTAAFSPVTLTGNRTITIPDRSGTLAVSASGNLSLNAGGIVSISNSPNFTVSVTTPALLSSGSLNITSGGQLSIGTTSQQLTLLGNGSTTLASTSGSFTSTVGFTSPTANRTISFPDATGTICLQNSSSCGFALSGSSVTSVNGLGGALTVANASGSGSTITINTASTTQLGLAQFNGTNFSVASGVVNTIQDIASSASPTFAGLTLGASGLTDNGAATFNGTTSVSGSNTFTVGSGAVSFGGTFGVAGLSTLSGGLTVAGASSLTGTTTINTTGTAATTIGNASGSFQVTSSGFNVTTGGAVSGVSTLAASGALSAATSGNTLNGLIINGGALSSVTGYSQASGNFVQGGSGSFGTGTGAVSLNGNTSVTGSNSFTVGTGTTTLGGALNVTGAGTISGGLNVGSSSQFQVNTSGNVTSGTINGQTISSSANFTGTVTVQGSSLALGVAATTAGSLVFNNTSNSHTVTLQGLANASSNLTLSIPAETNSSTTTDTVCLLTLANCVGAGGAVSTTAGTQNYITKYNNGGATQITNSQLYDNGSFVGVNTTTNNGQVSVVANGTQAALFLQGPASGSTATAVFQSGGGSGDLLDLENSSATVLAKIDASGNLTAVGGAFSGNISQTGASSFSTGTAAVSLNGNTTVAGSKTFTTGSGTVTLGSLGSGLVQSNSSGVLSSGAVDRNSSTFFSNALSTANGGTGTSSFTSGGVLYGNAGGALQATAAGTSGQVLLANGSGIPTFTSLSGDLTVNSSGVTTIGNAVVTGAKIASATVANSNLVNSSITINNGTNLTGGGLVSLGGSLTVGVANNPTFSGLVTGQAGLAVTGAAVNLNASSNFATNINTGTSTGAVTIGNSGNTTTIGGTLTANGAATFAGNVTVQGATGLTIGVAGSTNGTLNLTNSGNTQLSALQTAAPTGTGNVTYVLPTLVGGTSDTICVLNAANCATTGASGSGFIRNQYSTVQAGNFFIQNAGLTNTPTAIIEQSASQTADLLQFQNSGTTVIARIDASGNLTANSVLSNTFDTPAAGTLSLGNTNATGINIGTTANARSINIGTGAAAQTTTIGSTNTSSPLTLQAGTSSIALTNSGTAITGTSTHSGLATFNNGVNVATGNLTVAATAIANALQATSLDTASAGTLTIGGTNASSIALNNASLTTNQTTVALLNTTATTVNAFGAATNINLGASTGTTTINTPSLQLGATGGSSFVGFVGNTSGVTGFHSVASAVASATTGAISLRSGNSTGTTANSGAVIISTGSATAAAGNINIDTGAGGSGTPTINIGSNTATPGTITASTNARQINIGNTSGNTGVTIQGGALGAVNINSTTSSTGTITIGNSAAGALSIQGSSTLNVASTNFSVSSTGVGLTVTGAAGQDIADFKNSSSATVASVTSTGGLQGPSLDAQTASSTLAIGNTNATTINLGNTSATASSLNLGTGTAAAQTVKLGSTNSSSATTIQAGTSSIALTNSGTSLTGTSSYSGLATFNGGVTATTSTGTNGTYNVVSNVTNTNITATPTVVAAFRTSLTGTLNSNGSVNTLTGLSLASVTPVAGNVFNGLFVGTGYDNILNNAGTTLIGGTGNFYTPSLDSTSATSTLAIGNTNATTINLGNTTATASALNLGTGTSAAQTVKLGSTNTSSATTLQAGTSSIALTNSGTTVAGSLTVNNASTFKSGLTVGVAGPSGTTGNIVFNNSSNSQTVTLQAPGLTGAGNAILQIPTQIVGGSTDTICLLSAHNCVGVGGSVATSGGAQYYLPVYTSGGASISDSDVIDNGFLGVFTATNLGGQLSVAATSNQSALYLQGYSSGAASVATFKGNGSSGDLLDLYSGSTKEAYVTAAGALYAQNATITTALQAPSIDSQSGTLAIGTGASTAAITIGSSATSNLNLTTPLGYGVVAITGNTTYNGSTSFISTNSASGRTISVAAPTTSGTAGDSLTISAAAGYGTNQKGGNLILQGGANTGIGTDGGVQITNGSTTGSVNAFSVQDASGNTALNVNTTIQSDLISNSNFETNTSGWTASDGSTTLTQTTYTYTYDGQHAGQITTGGGSQTSTSGVYYTFATKPAAGQYTLSFFIAKNTGTMASLAAGYNQATGTFSQANNVSCTLNTTSVKANYSQVYCTFTAANAINTIFIQQGDSTARTFYIDDVTLVSGSQPSVNANDTIELGTVDSPLHIEPSNDSTDVFDIQGYSSGSGTNVCTNTCNTLRVDTYDGNVSIDYAVGTLPTTMDQLDVNGTIGAVTALSAPALYSTSGTLNINNTGSTNTTNIGNTAATNTITIGNSSTGVQTISIGTGGSSNTQLITIGTGSNSGTGVSSSDILQGGFLKESINSATSGTIGFTGLSTSYDSSAGTGTDLVSSLNEALTTVGNWTASGSGSSISAVHTSGSAAATALTPSISSSLSVGEVVTVSFTISSRSGGNVNFTIGGVNGSSRSSNGTFSQTITLTSTANLTFVPGSSFAATITNVTIVPAGTTLPLLTVYAYNNNTPVATLEVRDGGAGNANTFIGLSAGQSNSLGTSDTALGATALQTNTSGTNNVALGDSTLRLNTSGSFNVATGSNTLSANTTGQYNTATGTTALSFNTTGSYNTAYGGNALALPSSNANPGNYLSAFGYSAEELDGDSFYTAAGLTNSTALGANAQVQANNNLILGSIGTSGNTNVGIGTTQAINTLSVESLDSSVSTAGTVTQSGNTITGTGTNFTSAMIGDQITFSNGLGSTAYTPEIVSTVTSTTSMTVSQSQTITGTSSFRLHRPGLQVQSSGTVCIGLTSCNSANEALGVKGNVIATGTVSGGGSPDIAETIPAASDVQAYDVVSAGPDGQVDAVRSGSSYDHTAIGVISDGSSTFLINANSKGIDTPLTGLPLVLAGRVPVHVTNEGGTIEPGDYLTTSSTPGYAMKATHAGPTIGKALAAFDGTSGTVMVQTNLGYYAGPTQTDDIQNGGDATLNNLTVNGALDAASINVGDLATIGTLQVTGSASIGGDLTIGGGLTVTGLTAVQDLQVNGHFITAGNAPTASLLDAAGSAGASVAVSGNDTSGTITITVGQASAAANGSTPAISGPTIGDLLKLTFNKQYGKTPRIIITGNDANSAKLLVFPDAAAAGSFNLSISGQPTASTTYSFNYFSVE